MTDSYDVYEKELSEYKPTWREKIYWLGYSQFYSLKMLLFRLFRVQATNELVHHAIRELYISDENPDFAKDILKIVRIFSRFNYSTEETVKTLSTLSRILQLQELTPLTNHPGEWEKIDATTWQNNRNPMAFSENGGETYYFIPFWEKTYIAAEPTDGVISYYET